MIINFCIRGDHDMVRVSVKKKITFKDLAKMAGKNPNPDWIYHCLGNHYEGSDFLTMKRKYVYPVVVLVTNRRMAQTVTGYPLIMENQTCKCSVETNVPEGLLLIDTYNGTIKSFGSDGEAYEGLNHEIMAAANSVIMKHMSSQMCRYDHEFHEYEKFFWQKKNEEIQKKYSKPKKIA